MPTYEPDAKNIEKHSRYCKNSLLLHRPFTEQVIKVESEEDYITQWNRFKNEVENMSPSLAEYLAFERDSL